MWCDVNLNDPCMSGDCWQSSAGCTTPRKDVWDDAVDAIAPMMTSGTFNLGVGGFSGADCDNLPDPFLNMTTSADLQLTPSLFTNAAKFGAGDPTGTTPTGAALAGVLEDDLYNLADDAETRRSKAVVLVTDGEPTSCPADDTEAEQNAVVQAKALAEAGIPVYVLGFAGVRDDIMDAISYAGSIQYHANVQGTGDSTGTPQCTLPDQDDCWCADTSPTGCWSISDYGQAQTGRRLWYEVNDTQAIVDALEEIAWSTTTCILPLGESCVADFEISAVKLIGAGECTDSPSADCYVPESASNGYQIDYQPTEDPSADGGVGCDEGTARIYGSWCRYLIEKVQADPEVAVEARIGCQCSGVEICADGVDNDCDGQTDEGCGIIIE